MVDYSRGIAPSEPHSKFCPFKKHLPERDVFFVLISNQGPHLLASVGLIGDIIIALRLR